MTDVGRGLQLFQNTAVLPELSGSCLGPAFKHGGRGREGGEPCMCSLVFRGQRTTLGATPQALFILFFEIGFLICLQVG